MTLNGCTCGKQGRKGPFHAHDCPVFAAWSNRDTPSSMAARAVRTDEDKDDPEHPEGRASTADRLPGGLP